MNGIRPFSFKARVFRFAVAAMSAVAAMECFGAGAEPQEVQIAPRTLPPLPSLQWRLPAKYATLDGDRLVIDIPAGAYPADAVAEADLPAGLFAGADAELRNDVSFGGMRPDAVTLMLGLQDTSGHAEFDLSTLRGAPSPGLFRRINQDTPIIIESNGSDAPPTYEYLSPLRMDNVIYQVHCYAPMPFTHQGVHGAPVGPRWPDPEKKWDADFLREVLRPVREFEKRHHAKIYVGEFSAIAWAEGAGNYLRDGISVFEEYGWDWTYHAFREWKGWSVEHEGPDDKHMIPSSDNPRKRALLEGFTHP